MAKIYPYIQYKQKLFVKIVVYQRKIINYNPRKHNYFCVVRSVKVQTLLFLIQREKERNINEVIV